MNLIHRHIFANVVLTCGAAVGLFAFVLMLGNALKDIMPHIVAGQLGFDTVVMLIALMVPVMFSYALPIGMLAGVLLVLGRMSSDREVTALRASGLSVAWLSAPILFLAMLGVVATAVVNFEFMPRAKVAYETLLAQSVVKDPLSLIVPKTFIREFPGVVVYVGEKQGDLLKDIWFWKLDKQKRVINSGRAADGWLRFDEAKGKLSITLDQAYGESRDPKDPEDPSKVRAGGAFDSVPLDVGLDKLTGRKTINVKSKWLTLSQLVGEWRRLGQPDPAVPADERAKQRMRMQVTIHEKFASAFSVLSFALIAVPLGIKISRKETSANLVIGMALFMTYYFATFAINLLDNYPALRPDLLMWLPNLGFQALGFWMFYKVDRV